MDLTEPESQNCSEMICPIPRSSPTPTTPSAPSSSTTSTPNQLTARAPDAGLSAALQLPTEQLQPTPPINPLGFAPYHLLDAPVAPRKSQSHWGAVAGAPHGLALAVSDTIAFTSFPSSVVVTSGDHESRTHPDLRWAPSITPQSPVAPSIFHLHQTFGPGAGGMDLNLSQSAGAMRPGERHDRVTARPQRPAVSHPYVIPPDRDHAGLRAPLSLRTGGTRDRTLRDPDWRLTLDTYEWLFAVMYPKRRPDKRRPTPSGPCQLCESTCKRPGILQQHVTILHRQRLARKHLAGKPYDCNLRSRSSSLKYGTACS